MTPLTWLGLAAAAVGLVIGTGVMVVARRTASTREQAVRRQQVIQYVVLAVIAAFLTFDAITATSRARYFYVAVVAFIAAALAFDWFRARRRHRTIS